MTSVLSDKSAKAAVVPPGAGWAKWPHSRAALAIAFGQRVLTVQGASRSMPELGGQPVRHRRF